MSSPSEIGVGLMGLGVVGGGVAEALLDPGQLVSQIVGCPVRLRKILVRDLDKRRLISSLPADILTTDPRHLLEDPEILVLIEVMGGETPAVEYIRDGFSSGKHVVTANKEVMAKHGPDLISMAAASRLNLLFEASVGGGIPIVGPLMKDLLANQVSSIHAIINGTTNYILTRMARDRIDFSTALMEAQNQGYAEADPTSDVDGIDAAYKLAVLATLAFHTIVRAEDVYREGISHLQPQDFRYAQELGYAIKLLAIAKRDGDSVQARVHPSLVPLDHMLAKVEGVFNAVEVEADLIGRVLFHGMGAGRNPTASAVVGDIVEIARRLRSGSSPLPAVELGRSIAIAPMSSLTSRYYLRLTVEDRAGVFAQIGRVLGKLGISIASVIQKGTDPSTNTAEIVVTTHPALESAVQESIKQMEDLQMVSEIQSLVRLEDWSLN